MIQKAKILYVEDDETLRFVTLDNLKLRGYDIHSCENGNAAWEIFKSEKFDLCILDIMLPELDGFSLAQKIRKVNDQIPILFLTAKSLPEDKIKGLKLGADDYITKPFSVEELCLRIEVFLKRSLKRFEQKVETIEIGTYIFDFSNLKLKHPEQQFSLTQMEGELLHYFWSNRNKLVKREDILNTLWEDDNYFNGRSLDVFIFRIRKYLKLDASIQIKNKHGVGFIFQVNP